MRDAGYKMHTRCAHFPVPDSALGARYPAFGVDPVPGTRDAAGESGNKAECLAHASKTRTRGLQDNVS